MLTKNLQTMLLALEPNTHWMNQGFSCRTKLCSHLQHQQPPRSRTTKRSNQSSSRKTQDHQQEAARTLEGSILEACNQRQKCMTAAATYQRRGLQPLRALKEPGDVTLIKSLDFVRAFEEFRLEHEHSCTPHQFETAVMTDGAVRRAQQGTASDLVLRSRRWLAQRRNGMLLLCAKHSRLLGRWMNTIEKRFNAPFDGPIIPSRSEILSRRGADFIFSN